jgi:DNA-binding CsgD family transcriptional regulator/Tfp pilus assembly protein PilF
MLKAGLRAFREESLSEEEELRWLWLACHISRALTDDEAWDELTARHLELARQTGAFALLPVALDDRLAVDLFSGRLGVAMSLAAEAEAIVAATGSHLSPSAAITIAGWRGREADAVALFQARQHDVLRRGEGLWFRENNWSAATLYNGLGRYDDALAAAERAAANPRGLGVSAWVLSDLVEAAVRSGHPERATAPLERLAEIAVANDAAWGHGVFARAQALCSEGETAEQHYREAIEQLGRTRIRVGLARSHLVYGEWLRREKRRVDARQQLRTAHQILTEIGMDAMAERARRELMATGETVRRRRVETLDDLTNQEAHIARLAGAGRTNAQIGAQLFLSPRTVEWHLRNIFMKLGIGSRKELSSALADGPAAGVPA